MNLFIYFLKIFSGDIISTGTPPGVGVFRSPPQFLHKGQLKSKPCLQTPIFVGCLQHLQILCYGNNSRIPNLGHVSELWACV